jgi:hypothetical protein
VDRQGANLTDGNYYEWRRCYLIECTTGLALSDTVLTDWRDDVKTPATLTLSTGTLKTDASGDTNTDGFNERHGWHEITCAAGVAEFNLPVASGTRYMPAFRFHSATLPDYAVRINGSLGAENTDYVLDAFSGDEVVVQLLANYTSGVDVELEAAASGASYAGSRYTMGQRIAGSRRVL